MPDIAWPHLRLQDLVLFLGVVNGVILVAIELGGYLNSYAVPEGCQDEAEWNSLGIQRPPRCLEIEP